MQHSLLVEGWRGFPHSYAAVNHFQCVEFLRRTGLRLAHRDAPHSGRWTPVRGLFRAEDEAAVGAIPAPLPDERFDATLRIAFPYDFGPSPSRRTYVFGTAENKEVAPFFIVGNTPLAEAMARSEAVVVTPSQWSRQGFLRRGAAPERVVVVPHGIDPRVHRPLPPEEREALRRRLGWSGFVFLVIGAMTGNKNVDLVLRALAVVAERHPDVRLFAKGLDGLYGSLDMLKGMAGRLTSVQRAVLAPRLTYSGQALSIDRMAELYQAADAYVAPYSGEAFNMPVLEAAACGLPVICTAGGPTDDFTTSNFALHIDSTIVPTKPFPGHDDADGFALQPDFEHLIQLMSMIVENGTATAHARVAGPAFVTAGYTWPQVTDRLLELLFPATS